MLTAQVSVILTHERLNLFFNCVDVEYTLLSKYTVLSKSLIVDAQNFQANQQTSLFYPVLTT